MSWLSWDHFLKLLGVLGFVISVTTLWSTTRNRTVKPQPELLSELRNYLDFALMACSNVRLRLNFDRYQLEHSPKPDIGTKPRELDEAVARMPELGFTITSIGQQQINLLKVLIQGASENWKSVEACLDAKPLSYNALEFSRNLKRQCRIIEKFFPEYVDAVTAINKGNMWKRFKYRDHRAATYKIFRWKPLHQRVNEYERFLNEF